MASEKAVLISIQPQWVEKILNGEKTIEVRKTAPKLKVPFKCYVYCSKGDRKKTTDYLFINYDGKPVFGEPHYKRCCNGKVVAEFVCDKVSLFGYDEHIGYPTPQYEGDPSFCDCGEGYWITCGDLERICISHDDLMSYGNKKDLYGWNISDLKIYDRPKLLGEFERPCKCVGEYEGETYCDCLNCDDAGDSDCGIIACDRKLERPPQSWCYVEEIKNAGQRKAN